ncbi:MAG: serine--tRNA ligase [Geminicoccaceae bacterium]
MHDLRALRADPQGFDAAMARRGLPPVAQELLALDERIRSMQARGQQLEAERNTASRDIGRIKQGGGDASEAIARVAELKSELASLKDQERDTAIILEGQLAGLPNLITDEVPDGADEEDNQEVRRSGSPRNFAFDPLPHDELGAALGMDFERAAKLSGARFVVLSGGLARLERALAQFMLDLHVEEHGYREVHVPYLVREQAMYGSNQLPKFADEAFHTTSDHWLIPTSEVALANLHAGEILDLETLPLRFTAYSPCFRAEAGAAGKDTKGMIRQHQFTKVELVSVTEPESSVDEHERMTRCAETVLERLELPYRTVTLCAGDIGFGAQKTYDIEVWLPGQGRYREISSCSNCGAFQARRMNCRFRPDGEKRTEFVHTLNGSGVAVGRALVAVVENYQEEGGSVIIPPVLRPYMSGLERLVRS